MSLDRPNETEAELVERRGREAAERARIFEFAVKARREAGIPDIQSGPAAFGPSIQDQLDRGTI